MAPRVSQEQLVLPEQVPQELQVLVDWMVQQDHKGPQEPLEQVPRVPLVLRAQAD